jgi:hypothetical protein
VSPTSRIQPQTCRILPVELATQQIILLAREPKGPRSLFQKLTCLPLRPAAR